MVEGLAGRLQELGEGPVILYARDGAVDWPELSGIDRYAWPGRGIVRSVGLLGHLLTRRRVLVVGADCLDGHYSTPNSVRLIRLADVFARCGVQSTIIGSSYKENAKPETASALAALSPKVKLCARDADSAGRMRKATNHLVNIVADAAFMVVPDNEGVPAEVSRWIQSQRDSSQKIVAVNFNRQVIKDDPKAQQSLLDSYAVALKQLVDESGVSVLLVPHDYRGTESDLDHAQELCEKIDRGNRVMVAPGRLAPSVVKAIVSKVDIALTGRMHLAIGCLGVGTPPACVTYQGKFEGLFRHFGLEAMTLDPASASAPSKLLSLIRSVLDREEQLREQIADKKPSIIALSHMNLEPEPSDV